MNITKVNVINQGPKASFLGSIQSIKIPIIRQPSEMESDLTELSWLTNNINILAPKLNNTSIHQPKANLNVIKSKSVKRKEQKNFDSESQVCLKSPESPSSVSSSSSCSSMSPCLSPCSACNPSHKTSKKTSKRSIILNDTQSSISHKNNCGLNKPSITLSCLIFMALEESSEKCLPVREIYEWVEENFPYYRNNENFGWKSSIRHNLSFSKCFKKMDRNESVFLRQRPDSLNMNLVNGRKRRAPNSIGTCWKVNEECKAYLIHTLKKSAFWSQNSKHYPNLALLVNNFDSSDIKSSHHGHYESVNINKKHKLEANENSFGDYLNEYNENLLEFVQKQQEKLCNSIKSELDERIDLSASSSSLSSAFSSLSSDDSGVKRLRIDEEKSDKLNLSSDLEMEVASTLVDMKRFASRNKN